MPDSASFRESNGQYVKGKSPGFSDFARLLIRQLADNGSHEQNFS